MSGVLVDSNVILDVYTDKLFFWPGKPFSNAEFPIYTPNEAVWTADSTFDSGAEQQKSRISLDSRH